jgi:hypothetical protein
MANTFKRKLSRSLGVVPTAVGSYTVGASTSTTLIGLTLANVTADAVTANITLSTADSDYYIVKDAPVPSGGTLVAVGGDQKVVMEVGDSIKVTSSDSDSIDVIMSFLEIT